MDQASVEGAITLSSGGTPAFTWPDDSTVRVSHADWAEATEINVTIGTGCKDKAGNPLPQQWSSSFWTESSTVVLLTSTPANGASDVLLNSDPMIRFSTAMDVASLTSATSITEVPSTKALPFWQWVDEGGYWYRIDFANPLAANHDYTITISTDAESTDEQPLASEVVIAFSTGEDSDDVPPEFSSVTPAVGSTVNADQPSIVITFTEPVMKDDLTPSRVSAQILPYVGAVDAWNPDGTAVTIYLRPPLPAGVRLFAVFDAGAFRDLAGNYNAAADSVSFTVAGNADYFPVDPAWTWYFTEIGQQTTESKGSAKQTWDDDLRVTVDNVSGDNFDYVTESAAYPSGWEESDREYRRETGAGLFIRGFLDDNGGDPVDVLFNPIVPYQRYPFAAEDTWTGTSTVTSGDMTATLEYSGMTVGQENLILELDLKQGGPGQVVVEDCWRAVLEHEIILAEETVDAGTDTIWYAPGIGVVQEFSSSAEALDEGGTLLRAAR
jgi:hypothetical protein